MCKIFFVSFNPQTYVSNFADDMFLADMLMKQLYRPTTEFYLLSQILFLFTKPFFINELNDNIFSKIKIAYNTNTMSKS